MCNVNFKTQQCIIHCIIHSPHKIRSTHSAPKMTTAVIILCLAPQYCTYVTYLPLTGTNKVF